MNLGPEKQVLCQNHFTVFKKKASILILRRMTGACPTKLSALAFLLWGFSCTSFFIQTAVNLQTISTHHRLVLLWGNPLSIPEDHRLAHIWLRGGINYSGHNTGRGTLGMRCFSTFRSRLPLLRRENWGPEPLSLQITVPEPRSQFLLASLPVDRPPQCVPPVTLGQFRTPPKRLERPCPQLCHPTPA